MNTTQEDTRTPVPIPEGYDWRTEHWVADAFPASGAFACADSANHLEISLFPPLSASICPLRLGGQIEHKKGNPAQDGYDKLIKKGKSAARTASRAATDSDLNRIDRGNGSAGEQPSTFGDDRWATGDIVGNLTRIPAPSNVAPRDQRKTRDSAVKHLTFASCLASRDAGECGISESVSALLPAGPGRGNK